MYTNMLYSNTVPLLTVPVKELKMSQ